MNMSTIRTCPAREKVPQGSQLDPLEGLDSPSPLPPMLIQSGKLYEERDVQASQLFPPVLHPFLVSIPGQGIPGVRVQRRPVGRRLPVAAGRLRGGFEDLHVYPQGTVRAQCQASVVQSQVS